MSSSPPNTRDLRYLQIANYLREKVLAGKYKPGDCLPGQQKLAKELNISFATLQRALDILDREGYVARKAGHRTLVTLPEEHQPATLIVDDDESVRRVLKRALENRGWRSIVAESGEVALEEFKKQRFDLVFLDLSMPGMSGAETFREIRHVDPWVQVAIVTANVDSNLMTQMFQQALQVGLFAVIRKPITPDDLTMVLRDVPIGADNPSEKSRTGLRSQVA